MNRWIWSLLCAVVGAAMVICGLLIPAHLRAVDARVVQQAGQSSTSLVERGMELAEAGNTGAARMLWQAAQRDAGLISDRLGSTISSQERQHREWQTLGMNDPRVQRLLQGNGEGKMEDGEGALPTTSILIQRDNRERVLEFLRTSPLPGVQELLRCRKLTSLAIFSPSDSAAGQPLDAAIGICGLLWDGGHLKKGLSEAVFTHASQANLGASAQPLEQALLDLMSLGQRFNWGQLVALVERVDDSETLRILAAQSRNAGDQLPELFAAVELSSDPANVAKYLVNFSQSGVKDLGAALRYGSGGINELVSRNQRLYVSSYHYPFALNWALQKPIFALTVKWLLYLAGGFLLAAALHFARPPVTPLERPLQVRGFHVAREILFALGFLLVVLLLSEPFLAQESQRAEFPFRLRLPTVGSVVPAGFTRAHPTLMNQLAILTLLLFFVLQALLYTACLVKLAEIRRQNVAPRIKLRLLENEEHLFDAGLYVGFAGTIISLILVSMNIIKPSLMAAYSSTSFGIVFVSIFKIFHLRPEKRKLLLESETGATQTTTVSARPSLVTAS